MQYSTTGPSTVPPEPVVPETQMLPVMKVPMQYGTAGPSINTQADLFEDRNESEVTTSEQQNQPNSDVTDDE